MPQTSAPTTHNIAFSLGNRRVFAIQKQLVTVGHSLDALLSGSDKVLPDPPKGSDGYRVLSAPICAHPRTCPHNLLISKPRKYRRNYIAMNGGFEGYMAQFSGKTRATLRRKARKLTKESGGQARLLCCPQHLSVETYFDNVAALAAKTYQARLLDAALPQGREFRDHAAKLADQDRLRAFLLTVDHKPVSYLYCSISNNILRYDYLGYDPDYASLSVGTILQMQALETLFEEQRYRYFDFTEGDGAHKRLFATHHIDVCDYYALRPGLGNHILLKGQALFNRSVEYAKSLLASSDGFAPLRRVLRG